MVLGPALADDRVLAMAAELSGHRLTPQPGQQHRSSAAVVPEGVAHTTLVVVGHHLSGQPRSADLIDAGGSMITLTETAQQYRLLRVGEANPVPVLVTAERDGAAVEVETWTVPSAALPTILAASSRSVCLGRVALADGSTEIGFVADTSALSTADVPPVDITAFGGWRKYLASTSADAALSSV